MLLQQCPGFLNPTVFQTFASQLEEYIGNNPSDDATVRSWEPDQALGQDDYLELSYWSIDVPKGEYVLVRFDVAAALPADAIIDSAQMEFYVVDALSPSTAPSATTWAWT